MKILMTITMALLLMTSVNAKDKKGKNLSPEIIAQMELEFSSFQKEQHDRRLSFENTIYEKQLANLKSKNERVLILLSEMRDLKFQLKFKNKEKNKAIKLQMKEKRQAFKKTQVEFRKSQRDAIKSLRQNFKASLKEERHKLRAKLKSLK